MELDYKTLGTQMCQLGKAAALIEYIFKTQGDERRRLKYDDAAASLGVSKRTIGRYVDRLADKKLLVLYGTEDKHGGEVQLSVNILTV